MSLSAPSRWTNVNDVSKKHSYAGPLGILGTDRKGISIYVLLSLPFLNLFFLAKNEDSNKMPPKITISS